MKRFEPGFKDLQLDIERYLASIGKRDTRKDGMIVFRGYDDALKLMFDRYLEAGALAPLANHFRAWNWEYSYNDHLIELTSALKKAGDWPNLRVLWGEGVIRARRKLYNDMWKIEKNDPGTLKAESVTRSKEALLEALGDIGVMAEEFGTPEAVEKYAEMARKVREGKKA